MDSKRVLPVFRLGAFIINARKRVDTQTKQVTAEAEDPSKERESGRVEYVLDSSVGAEETLTREEGAEGKNGLEKEDRKTFWTTQGQRPIAEPPILDWEEFERLYMPSDLRYRALFPDDPGKRCQMKDVDGERHVLLEYIECMKLARDDPETAEIERCFYSNLVSELFEDYDVVDEEYRNLWTSTPGLPRFEFMYLDNDGQTTQLEHWVKKGANVLNGQGEEVKGKYGYLLPASFVPNRLALLEFNWQDNARRNHGRKRVYRKGMISSAPPTAADQIQHATNLSI